MRQRPKRMGIHIKTAVYRQMRYGCIAARPPYQRKTSSEPSSKYYHDLTSVTVCVVVTLA